MFCRALTAAGLCVTLDSSRRSDGGCYVTSVLSQTVGRVERLRAEQPGFGPNRIFQRPAVSGAHPGTYSRNGVTLPEVKAPGAWERPSHLHLVDAPSTWRGAYAHTQLYIFLMIQFRPQQ